MISIEIKHDVVVRYGEHIGPIVGLAFALLIAGCSGVKPAPPAAQPPTAATAVAPTASPAPVPSPPNTAVVTPSAAAAPESTNPPVTPPTTPSQSAAKAIPPVAKAPSAVAPKAPVEPLPKKESPAPDVAKKAPATLDLKSLEQQLKDTKAIGVLTKIALKNQVDDLLDKFRAFYQGKLKTTLAELRQPYDLLVLKVLSLLQDSDPSLASSIAASREAIWGILADPKKFATI
jgi:hypothetical protein